MRSRLWISLVLLPALTLPAAEQLAAQRVAENTYWYYFRDKKNNEFSLDHPEEFLSERSLQRRAYQGIDLDMTDLPVSAMYLDSLDNLGVEVVHWSRWLNGVLIETADRELAEALPDSLLFVTYDPWEPDPSVKRSLQPPSDRGFDPAVASPLPYDYGFSGRQVEQLSLHHMHDRGYRGAGVIITVLDGGFGGMDNDLPAFRDLFGSGRFFASRNFVRNYSAVYNGMTHGTSVSSLIVGKWDGMLIGTAPEATLVIATTENGFSETKIEEFAWIQAAEWADSLGTDVINTSLGYSTFDDPATNYTYEDMDGRTAFISRASGMLADKGIVGVSSAGNSGDDSWFYITAPADAEDILAVGAVDSLGVITNFSSRGPTYDHRIKPDVVARGRLNVLQGGDGEAYLSNGTSYASPLIAGGVAALWQAHPDLSARELIRAVQMSGNRYYHANTTYGYGLPNFIAAFHAISSAPGTLHDQDILVYPNPFKNLVRIGMPAEEAGNYQISVYDLHGRVVFRKELYMPGNIHLPEHLEKGMYLLVIENEFTGYRARITK